MCPLLPGTLSPRHPQGSFNSAELCSKITFPVKPSLESLFKMEASGPGHSLNLLLALFWSSEELTMHSSFPACLCRFYVILFFLCVFRFALALRMFQACCPVAPITRGTCVMKILYANHPNSLIIFLSVFPFCHFCLLSIH